MIQLYYTQCVREYLSFSRSNCSVTMFFFFFQFNGAHEFNEMNLFDLHLVVQNLNLTSNEFYLLAKERDGQREIRSYQYLLIKQMSKYARMR